MATDLFMLQRQVYFSLVYFIVPIYSIFLNIGAIFILKNPTLGLSNLRENYCFIPCLKISHQHNIIISDFRFMCIVIIL